MINRYLTRLALPLGIWFVVEYMVHVAATHNIMLQFFVLPMMLATPFMAWYILKQLRDRVMGERISGLEAWTFGTQLFFYAGLIEAMFIYLYNEFIAPNNLMDMQQALIAQYEEVCRMLNESQSGSFSALLNETVEELKKSPVPSAIEAAVNQLSSTLFQGLMIMIPVALILRKKTITKT